jgi:hypothetical protein
MGDVVIEARTVTFSKTKGDDNVLNKAQKMLASRNHKIPQNNISHDIPTKSSPNNFDMFEQGYL